MSRKHGTLEFSGGMNNVVPPHLLKDNEAEEIRNLYLDDDGIWKDINDPETMLDLSATHLANAVIVKQWKPTKVPSDCIDDFVYVVFCSDGVAKLVYRGTAALQVFTLDIKARVYGTTNYRAVAITNVTPDLDGNANGTTSSTSSGVLTRRYNENTAVSMTAPVNADAGEEFYHWIDGDTGEVLDDDRVLDLVLTASREVIAEYVVVPYIKVEDEDGNPITTLGTFTALDGEYSATKSYFTGGLSLTNPLKVYPPSGFEISLDESTWIANPAYIEISAVNANAGMTEIFVRLNGGA
jgi:hypothetical protein